MISHNPTTILQRPWRGPIEVPEALKEYHEDKKVVEIGCAAGDYIPTWSKYASHYTGYEQNKDWYSLAATRTDLRENVVLLNERVTPEGLPEADLYYAWSPEPEVKTFVSRMQEAGKTGVFAMYSGVFVEDTDKSVAMGLPYGRPVKTESDTFTNPLAWTDWPTSLVSFEASETDNRAYFDEYATGRRMQIILKELG